MVIRPPFRVVAIPALKELGPFIVLRRDSIILPLQEVDLHCYNIRGSLTVANVPIGVGKMKSCSIYVLAQCVFGCVG